MMAQLLPLIYKPHFQGLLFIIINILTTIIIRPKKVDNVWVISGVLYALFILINTVFVWFAANIWLYFFYSLAISVLYLFVASLIVPVLIKILNASGSGESGMIFLFIIYHPVALLLMIFAKWIFLKMF